MDAKRDARQQDTPLYPDPDASGRNLARLPRDGVRIADGIVPGWDAFLPFCCSANAPCTPPVSAAF